ncbi:copper homeostasis protein CutC [Rheinheimera sp.]|uniref:copper homeostasis protein CutC n=1 Tax=Rheinheimera sp. TaxID=1869214 RepID=UPI00307F8012
MTSVSAIPLEACINADDLSALAGDLQAVLAGGARRIELCGVMEQDGLTPSLAAMTIARHSLADLPGLLVMIRPRGGDFCYSAAELLQMQRSIELAAQAGADGVVLGLLTEQGQLDISRLKPLLAQSQAAGLQVTFHRAFDALPDPLVALEQLVDLGVQRILTAGTAWGSGLGILHGVPLVQQLLQQAAGRVELVLGGGVNQQNLPQLLPALQSWRQGFSIHSYSALLTQGRVDPDKVRQLTQWCR